MVSERSHAYIEHGLYSHYVRALGTIKCIQKIYFLEVCYILIYYPKCMA